MPHRPRPKRPRIPRAVTDILAVTPRRRPTFGEAARGMGKQFASGLAVGGLNTAADVLTAAVGGNPAVRVALDKFLVEPQSREMVEFYGPPTDEADILANFAGGAVSGGIPIAPGAAARAIPGAVRAPRSIPRPLETLAEAERNVPTFVRRGMMVEGIEAGRGAQATINAAIRNTQFNELFNARNPEVRRQPRALLPPPRTDTADAVYRAVVDNGGVTLDPRTGAPFTGSGFAVADPRFTHVISDAVEDPVVAMREWLAQPRVQRRLKRPGAYAAGWRDPETGQIEINVTDIVPERERALAVGRARDQKAVGELRDGAYVGDVPLAREVITTPAPSRPVDVEHRSPAALQGRVDPQQFGTGPVRGEERRRRDAFPDLFLPRSYFTVAGGAPEAGFESMPVYRGQLPRVYDIEADPLNTLAAAENIAQQRGIYGPAVASIQEQLIRDAGFPAYRRGDTVASFEPVPVAPARETVHAPAIRNGDGVVIEGNPGEIHAQIMERDPALYEDTHAKLGFVSSTGRWLSRSQAAKLVPGRAEEGLLDASALLPESQLESALDRHIAIMRNLGQGTTPSDPMNRILPHLLEVERAQLTAKGTRPATRERLVETHALLGRETPIEVLQQGMLAGAPARGGYAASAQALTEVFGEDAPRFATLMAALSPQQDVASNLRMALNMWGEWAATGRSQDPKVIANMLGRHSRRGDPEGKALKARVNNAVRALTSRAVAEEPFLSGPKVESFWRNLVGDTQRVTLDTHQAQIENVPGFAGRGLQTVRGDPSSVLKIPGADYLAGSARLREAAGGIGMNPAEGQETIWSWMNALLNRVGGADVAATRPGLLAANVPDVSPEAVRAMWPGLGEMFRDPYYAEILQRQGLPLPAARTTPALSIPQADPHALRQLARNAEAHARKRYLLGLGLVGLPGLGAAATPR